MAGGGQTFFDQLQQGGVVLDDEDQFGPMFGFRLHARHSTLLSGSRHGCVLLSKETRLPVQSTKSTPGRNRTCGLRFRKVPARLQLAVASVSSAACFGLHPIHHRSGVKLDSIRRIPSLCTLRTSARGLLPRMISCPSRGGNGRERTTSLGPHRFPPPGACQKFLRLSIRGTARTARACVYTQKWGASISSRWKHAPPPTPRRLRMRRKQPAFMRLPRITCLLKLTILKLLR